MRYTTEPIHNVVAGILREIGNLFNCGYDLSNLHLQAKRDYTEQFVVGADSSTEFHKAFYDKYREGWEAMESWYCILMQSYIAPKFSEDFLYQKFPTVRFHIPNHVAVGSFHKDADFGHPLGEINFVIPLTNSDDTASIWVESEPDKGDFEPMKMRVGELIQFNGNFLSHGNRINLTSRTRVSMDFRVILCSKLGSANTSQSITTKSKFTEGGYYKLFKK